MDHNFLSKWEKRIIDVRFGAKERIFYRETEQWMKINRRAIFCPFFAIKKEKKRKYAYTRKYYKGIYEIK